MAMQSDHEFAPTRIARAVFPTAFRGYDQDAVRRYLSRLAAALEHQQEYAGLGELEARTPAHERMEELEAEAEDLRAEIRELELELVQRSVDGQDNAEPGSDEQSSATPGPANEPVFDEHRAIELLGQETARVLESARSAAADILKRAETQASSLKNQAKSELSEAKRRAETLVTDKRTEAEEHATRLVTDAEATADRLTTEAETAAGQMTSDAEALAERVTTEATATAERVTTEASTEAERVRTEATEQAERLTAEAQAEAERVTAEAAAGAEQVTEEAEAHRSAVVEESTRMLAEAEQRAESDLADAEARARQIVADAETLRQQVIAELVSERRDAQVELDRMTAARDRLAMSLAMARSELDEVADALVDVSTIDLRGDESRPRSPAALALDAAVDDLAEPAPARNPAGGQPEDGPSPDGGAEVRSGTTKQVETKQPVAKGATNTAARSKKSSRSEPKSGGPAKTARTAKRSKRRSEAKPKSADASTSTAAAANDGAAKAATVTLPAPKTEVPDDAAQESAGQVTAEAEVAVEASGTGTAPQADGKTAEAESARELPTDFPDEALNPLPEDGELLSLVEGFTTIDLEDDGTERTGTPRQGGNAEDDGDATLDDLSAEVRYSVLVNEPQTPEEIITTVVARTVGGQTDRTTGDLPIGKAFTGRLPEIFAARDAAVARSMPGFRRQLRRALNDDQGILLERLRSGRGEISVDELPAVDDQIDRFLNPLRRGLVEVTEAGARVGGGGDLPPSAIDNLVRQLARHLVDRVRIPTIEVVSSTSERDRERILEPIRASYREFRNGSLPALAEDAVYEALAIGLYHSIEPAAPVGWQVDPRTDPDPVCEINRDRSDVTKGELFPSGHVRPLALPGCRCLVSMIDY